ncbi:putative folate-biopterin transporter 3 [Diplonema papillatum]|nr:putative folate-biopterin transporter 3 [Diplonema papillatum]
MGALSGKFKAATKAHNPMDFMRDICSEFSRDFVVLLGSSYFGVKGSAYAIMTKGQLPYYMDYMKASGMEYQRYSTFGMTPWALKSAIGAISDTFPIYGYHKGPYLIGASVMGCLSFLAVAVLPLRGEDVPPGILENSSSDEGFEASDLSFLPTSSWIAPMLFFFISLHLATVDLLCEGRYAAKMAALPHTSSSLVTWVWLCIFIGQLTIGSAVGPMADDSRMDARAVFYIGVPLSAQFLLPLFLGYLQEERVPPGPKYEKIKQNPRLFALAFVMAAAVLTNAVTSLWLENVNYMLALTIAWSLLLIALSFYSLPRMLASANTYLFLVQALYLQIPGAINSWFQANESCVPGGPNFSNTYYLTYSSIVGNLAALLGVVLFQVCFRKSTFRVAFWTTTVLRVMASAFDIIIVQRLHRPFISDKVMYMLGDGIVGEVISQLEFMPSVVLVSKLCPSGYESIVYSLLAGYQNFGQQVAMYAGEFLTDNLGLNPRKEAPCNFDNLAWLIAIAHTLLPMLSIPLVFAMIPDVKLTDDLLVGELACVKPSMQPEELTELHNDCDDESRGVPEAEDEHHESWLTEQLHLAAPPMPSTVAPTAQ